MEARISQGLITGMQGHYIAVLVKVTKTKRNNRFVWGQGPGGGLPYETDGDAGRLA